MVTEQKNDVVVVGAGPGGLASAILLAGQGLRVRVVERADRIGGRTSSFGERGFRFDLGPTFFLYPQSLFEIFESVGEDLTEHVDLVRLDPQYRVLFGAGGHIDATADIGRMQAEIARIAPGDAEGFPKFLAENRRKLAALEPVLRSQFRGWSNLLSRSVLESIPHIRPHLSVDGYLQKFFKDPRVRLAFSFQSKYLGMSPFQCPSLFSILSFLEYEYGVYHPIGGCAALTEAMARVAAKMGVEIHLNEQIDQTLFDGRRVVGMRSNSTTHRADAFVVNADFAHFMRRSVPDEKRRRWTDAKLDRKRFSCSTYMMYLGLNKTFDAPHHNILISSDYENNLREIEVDKVAPTDPSVYVQNAGITDPTLAPKGKSGLYILAPAPHESPSVDWAEIDVAFRSRVLERVRGMGFEFDEADIEYERRITPDNWRDQYFIHKGATFNLSHCLSQLLHNRPRNRFEDMDGVYLVGGGTHPGSGLPVIFESARITSEALRRDLGSEGVRELPELSREELGTEVVSI